MGVFSIVFNEINDVDAVPDFPTVRPEHCFEVFSLFGPALYEDILVGVFNDWLEAENSAITVQFLHLMQGEGMDVGIDCDLVGKNFMLVPLCVYLENGVKFALVKPKYFSWI
jgi:hypothetical protein